MTEFDFDARYKVTNWPGIAWHAHSFHEFPDEDTEWTGYNQVDYTKIECTMVGDDRVYVHDIDDLEKLSEDDYCPECGQIGCKAGM